MAPAARQTNDINSTHSWTLATLSHLQPLTGDGALQPLDACVRCYQGTGRATLVNLVDVPGHPRVRRAFERHLRGTRGIVFVVDALDFLPHKTETAE